ncbi:MAG: hypothetical protein LAT81_15460, partial [Oceanicaulis sp.]|nr:hypothetical protein [Oceanicaulis sp.]
LGDGTTQQRHSPVAVDSSGVLHNVTIVQVSAGDSHSLFLSDDGEVFSVGWNGHGQLGDGTTTSRLSPVHILPVGAVYPSTVKSVV